MEEMRNMIGARNAAMGFRARGLSFAENVLGRSQSSDSVSSPSRRADVSHRPSESQDLKRLTESIQNLVTTAEDNIVNAASSHARLEKDLRTLVAAYEEVILYFCELWLVANFLKVHVRSRTCTSIL